MIEIKPAFETLKAFSVLHNDLNLARLAAVLERKEHSDEELLLNYLLNTAMGKVIFQEPGEYNVDLGHMASAMFQWAMLSHVDEEGWPEGWEEPKTIAITRGGHQISREILHWPEYAVRALSQFHAEEPLTIHYLKHRDEFDSPYETIRFAQVLHQYPFWYSSSEM